MAPATGRLSGGAACDEIYLSHGKAKEKWGQLTDDDWAMISGERDQMVGLAAEEAAEGLVAEFERSFDRV